MAEDKLTRDRIAASDPNRVFELYQDWPSWAEQMLGRTLELEAKKYERVVYLAVGGSATAGDIVSDWFLSSGGPEVTVFRGAFPKARLDDALVIICSTSGETVETLRMAETASRLSTDVVTISHDGELSRVANRFGLRHVEIPLAKAPRYSLPYSLFASLSVLRGAGLLGGAEWELDDTVATMKIVGKKIAVDVPTSENPAKQVAEGVVGREPCIYATSVTKSVARRFKNSLNENAKMHARFDSAPDIFHNEVEAWEGTGDRQHPVLLRRSKDHAFEARALDAFEGILKSRGVVATRVEGAGDGDLAQLTSLCYVLDFASYYAAMLKGVEPFQITIIDELKKSR